MKIVEIKANPEKCVGCWNCRLMCSYTHDKIFSPMNSRIKVDQTPDGFNISFTDDCNKCGICTQYCAYRVLEAVRDENGEE